MPSDYDRIKAGLVNIIRRTLGAFIVQRIDFLAMYPAKVVAQNLDGTLELIPDDSRLPSYSKVPIRYGVPGVTATVSAGARCYIAFAGADPQKPMVVDWEAGSAQSIVLNGGSNGVARNGDAVKVTVPIGTFLVAATGGVLNSAPIDVTGTITAGSSSVKAG